MFKITYTESKESYEFRSNDKPLFITKLWDTDSTGNYFDPEADEKNIPIDPYAGNRMFFYQQSEWRVTQSGHLYQYLTRKKWDCDGKCSTSYHILPEVSFDRLKELDLHFGFDTRTGLIYGQNFIFENGKKRPIAIGTQPSEYPFANIVEFWEKEGYQVMNTGTQIGYLCMVHLSNNERKKYAAKV